MLGIPPGPEVGAAYRYLLELRLDRGPLGTEAAERELRAWWRARTADSGLPPASTPPAP